MYQDELKFEPGEILVYLRKSRSDDPLLSVEEVLQKHETILNEWAERNLSGKIPAKNYYREVVSGETIADRPKMIALLQRIESPKVKAILIVEVQRLSRGDLEDAGRLIKLLRYTNTFVITPQKTYDLRDEYDRDAFERELKRGNEFLEYQKKILNRGRLLSVQQGNFIGSIPPYGYRKIWIEEGKRSCPTLEIVEAEADVVRMIFDWYVNENLGRVTIAHRLNELGVKPRKGGRWAQDTIKTILENVHYIGKVKWNWRKTINIVEDGVILRSRPKSAIDEYLIFDGKHEAIVTPEIFQAAREKQGRNHRAKAKTKVRNPLAGLLYCQCGRAMTLRTYKKNGEERSAPRLLCDDQAHCKTTSCLYSEIIERVCEILQQCIDDFEIRITSTASNSAELHTRLIQRLQTQLAELERKEVSQWEKYSEEGMPKHIFDTLNEKVLREKEEVQQALCNAQASSPEPVNYEERLHRFREALEALQNPDISAARKNALLKTCIDRIVYNRGKAVRVTTQMVGGKGKLPTGGTWSTPPIELEVKLRL